MRLSRVVLTRENQEAIIQGMIHIAPDRLYQTLQKDVDWATENNYRIFFEGIKGDEPERTLIPNESNIRELFLFLFELYPAMAAGLGVSLQKEKIVYPKDAVNADITFSELTHQLNKNGFRCGLLLWLIKLADREEIKKEVEKDFEKGGDLNTLMDRSHNGSFGNFTTWLLLRKAMPIILDYRNTVVIAKIRTHFDGRKVFVHYGEKHIDGLVDLLKKDGWTVKEVTYTDLAKFC